MTVSPLCFSQVVELLGRRQLWYSQFGYVRIFHEISKKRDISQIF